MTFQPVPLPVAVTATAVTSVPETAQAAAAVSVLFVEDNPGDARLIGIQLRDHGAFRVEHAQTLAAALNALALRAFDVVLLDLSLPDSAGAATFDAVHAAAPATPVVVMTGLEDDEVAKAMVMTGAQDFVVKGTLHGPAIGRCLRHAIERYRLLRAVKTAQRREAELKDQFLAHVSHELRSPLAVSFLYTTNVLDGIVGPLTAEQHDHLAVAVDALRAQMRLIDDLLATVRSSASIIRIHKTSVSMARLIDQAVEGFGTEPGDRRIIVEADADLLSVHVDVDRIQQVLTNLVDNALKVTPPGGTVRIHAHPAPTEPGFVRVDVTDQGPGIPDEARERIFDRLFRSNSADEQRGGLGLGLYLCKLLVTRHGGRIWVEPFGDHGSRMSFTLPYLSASENAPQLQVS